MLLKTFFHVNLIDGKIPEKPVALRRQEGLDRLVVVEDLADVVNLDHQNLDVNLVPRNRLQNWNEGIFFV